VDFPVECPQGVQPEDVVLLLRATNESAPIPLHRTQPILLRVPFDAEAGVHRAYLRPGVYDFSGLRAHMPGDSEGVLHVRSALADPAPWIVPFGDSTDPWRLPRTRLVTPLALILSGDMEEQGAQLRVADRGAESYYLFQVLASLRMSPGGDTARGLPDYVLWTVESRSGRASVSWLALTQQLHRVFESSDVPPRWVEIIAHLPDEAQQMWLAVYCVCEAIDERYHVVNESAGVFLGERPLDVSGYRELAEAATDRDGKMRRPIRQPVRRVRSALVDRRDSYVWVFPPYAGADQEGVTLRVRCPEGVNPAGLELYVPYARFPNGGVPEPYHGRFRYDPGRQVHVGQCSAGSRWAVPIVAAKEDVPPLFAYSALAACDVSLPNSISAAARLRWQLPELDLIPALRLQTLESEGRLVVRTEDVPGASIYTFRLWLLTSMQNQEASAAGEERVPKPQPQADSLILVRATNDGELALDRAEALHGADLYFAAVTNNEGFWSEPKPGPPEGDVERRRVITRLVPRYRWALYADVTASDEWGARLNVSPLTHVAHLREHDLLGLEYVPLPAPEAPVPDVTEWVPLPE
jgi:hypothetical protein